MEISNKNTGKLHDSVKRLQSQLCIVQKELLLIKIKLSSLVTELDKHDLNMKKNLNKRN